MSNRIIMWREERTWCNKHNILGCQHQWLVRNTGFAPIGGCLRFDSHYQKKKLNNRIWSASGFDLPVMSLFFFSSTEMTIFFTIIILTPLCFNYIYYKLGFWSNRSVHFQQNQKYLLCGLFPFKSPTKAFQNINNGTIGPPISSSLVIYDHLTTDCHPQCLWVCSSSHHFFHLCWRPIINRNDVLIMFITYSINRISELQNFKYLCNNRVHWTNKIRDETPIKLPPENFVSVSTYVCTLNLCDYL